MCVVEPRDLHQTFSIRENLLFHLQLLSVSLSCERYQIAQVKRKRALKVHLWFTSDVRFTQLEKRRRKTPHYKYPSKCHNRISFLLDIYTFFPVASHKHLVRGIATYK